MGTNYRGEELTLFIDYVASPPLAETALIFAALDRAFVGYLESEGILDVQLVIRQVEIRSLKAWLGLVGIGIETAKWTEEHAGILTGFLEQIKIGVALATQGGAAAYLADLLGVCARPITEERATETRIESADNSVPPIIITNANAPIIFNFYERSTVEGRVSVIPWTSKAARPFTRSTDGADDESLPYASDFVNDRTQGIPKGFIAAVNGYGYAYPKDGLSTPIKLGDFRLFKEAKHAAPRFGATGELYHNTHEWVVRLSNGRLVKPTTPELFNRYLVSGYRYRVAGRLDLSRHPSVLDVQLIENI